jgi:hypothetical protein
MGIFARSLLAAVLATGSLVLAACFIDVDALTNGQCPDSKKAFENKCVDDIDECAAGLDNCDPAATCTNTPGSFTCACPAGTLDVNGNGTSCAKDGCAVGVSKCDPVAKCTRVGGDAKCTCPAGTLDVAGDGTKCRTGDSCATPIVVEPSTLPVKLTGTTEDGSPHYGFGAAACPGVMMSEGGKSNDKTYSFTPATTGDYVFRLTTTTFDAVLYLVTNCGKIAETCVGASDMACTSCSEQITAKLTAGTTYFVVVDGSGNTTNQSGGYTLELGRGAIQLDVSSVLTDDTVVNDGMGAIDPTQTTIDGTNDLPTQSVATKLGGPGAHGLPDNAFFPADANHSAVQLHWSNSDDGPNSRVVMAGDAFTFNVPSDRYTRLQLYGYSTNGASSVAFTLSYDDATTDVVNVTFVDWYSDPAPPGQFILINDLDRFANGAVDMDHDGAIFGINLAPDPAKKLVSVYTTQIGPGILVFLGATGQ